MSIQAPPFVGDTSQCFQYDKIINEYNIRLLKLDTRASPDDSAQNKITAKFVHASLFDLKKTPPPYPYVAISYCWGSSKKTDKLWISDTEYIPLTASAASILRCMSQSHLQNLYGDYVWIDQVCINQGNPEEKGHQVKMMFSIYYLASHVIAWLGGSDDDGALAMETLFDWNYALVVKDLLGRKPLFLPCDFPQVPVLAPDGGFIEDRTHAFYNDPKVRSALAMFFDRAWFGRAWIIQEMVAAEHITIMIEGDHYFRHGESWGTWPRSIEWEKFVKFAQSVEKSLLHHLRIDTGNIFQERDVLPKGFGSIRRIQSLRDHRRRTKQRTSFQHNLVLTMKAEASDPRDKIFSIASMSIEGDADELQPDYASPTADVYTRATRYLLTRNQTLDVLGAAGIGWNRRISRLPSWVPDYSQTTRTSSSRDTEVILGNIATSLFAAADHYFSGMNASIAPSWSKSSILQLEGILIDDVDRICPGLPYGRSLWQSLNSKNQADRQLIKFWFETVRSRICTTDPHLPYLEHAHPKVKPFLWKQRPCTEFEALVSALVVGLHDDRPWGHNTLDSDHGLVCNDLFDFLNFVSEIPDIRDDETVPLSSNDDRFGLSARGTLWAKSAVEASTTSYLRAGFDYQNRKSYLLTRAGAIDIAAMEAYLQSLEKFTNWCVFRTRSGYIGRGPPLMQPGDQVCVLRGSSTPFTVRKTTTPLLSLFGRWQLVGECYVQGLMHKEALYAKVSPWRWGPVTLV